MSSPVPIIVHEDRPPCQARLHRLACSKAFGDACALFNRTLSPLAVAEERVRRSPNNPKLQEVLVCARAARAEAIELLEATGKASEEADLAYFGF